MTRNGDTVIGSIADADWLVRPQTRAVLAALTADGAEARAVGGAVRNALMRVPVKDVDIATTALPEDVVELARRAGLRAVPTGFEHGTVTVVADKVPFEVTTLRQDVETFGRRARVTFTTEWPQDAMRRDFTMNALYAGMNGALFDPLHGLADCLAHRVRFIGEPSERIAEDRLRVYRFFRFSASHGNQQFDAAGLAACGAAANQLGGLAAERIGAEMRKMLGLPRVAKTIARMRDLAILDLPSTVVERLSGYERRARKPTFQARLALLLVASGAGPMQSLWRLSNDDIAVATAILAAARLIVDFQLNEAAYRYPAALTDAIDVAATLADWGDAGRLAVVEQLRRLDVPQFPVRGNDLLGIGMPAGKALGRELERLERAWIESGFALDRQALLELASRG